MPRESKRGQQRRDVQRDHRVGTIFAKITANADQAQNAIRSARVELKRFLDETRKELRKLGIRVEGLTLKEFDAGLNRLIRIYGPDNLLKHLRSISFDLLNKCLEAPIPLDTGALSRSGFVESEGKAAQVTLGFRRYYAHWMDVGNRRLAPKPYGSAVGPNYYFSRTIKDATPGVLPALADLVRRDIEKATFSGSGLGTRRRGLGRRRR